MHIRAAPCSGGYLCGRKQILSRGQMSSIIVTRQRIHRFNKQIDTRMYNRDYYITIAGYTDANVSLVAYAAELTGGPNSAGRLGYIEAKQGKLTLPMVK